MDVEAARWRIRAAGHRLQAAHCELAAASCELTAALAEFGRAVLTGEREAFEAHPDVQEAVAAMRGFYGETST